MRVKQFIGPFNNGPLDLGIGNGKIVQIGIERPQTVPLFPAWDPNRKVYLSELDIPKVVLLINDEEYVLSENDILEFGELYPIETEIAVVEASNPYLIINIAYQ